MWGENREMMVHRFIGLSELESLLTKGIVSPLEENGRNCLYFWDSENHDCPSYQLEYLSGVVGEIRSDKTEYRRFFCLVSCDIPEGRFKKEYMTYADPYGAWFDTILEDELHLFGEYKKEDVKCVRLYVDDRMGFKEYKSFDTIGDSYRFLTE